MNIVFQTAPAAWSSDALVLPLFEGEAAHAVCPELFRALPWLEGQPGLADFRGRKGDFVLLHGPAHAAVRRVLLAGLGTNDEKNGLTRAERLEALRNTAGAAAVFCREHGFASLAFPVSALPRHLSRPGEDRAESAADLRTVQETVCGALLGLYRNTAFKSGKSGKALDVDPKELALFWDAAAVPESMAKALCQAAKQGQIHAEAVIFARNLANAPGNRLTPADLADEASKLAARHGLHCEVLGMRELKAKGMGAFVCVGAGAACELDGGDGSRKRHAPCLVILDYTPTGHEDEAPLVVVGKGITFDSGGISLKPSAGMWEMKGDMGGAAAVLGLFDALPLLAVPRRVVGFLACAENMPGAYATRPGDVVTTLSGKTVEITNTDAEGRLVLCDTLTYAQERFAPDTIVDVATLTGACVVALGDDVAGLFCEEPDLAARIKGLGEQVGEAFWPLPLHERYMENLKSETADFANAGAREGGACSAAMFLKQFVNLEGVPHARWAHLDIAGPGFYTRKVPNCPAGASGFAVRTLIDFAQGDQRSAQA